MLIFLAVHEMSLARSTNDCIHATIKDRGGREVVPVPGGGHEHNGAHMGEPFFSSLCFDTFSTKEAYAYTFLQDRLMRVTS